MYTGLIHSVGQILGSTETPAGLRLTVAAPADLLTNPGPTPGESINIDGCCLSLVDCQPAPHNTPDHLALAFDATHQTLANTTLGRLTPGQRVHLERSCTPTTLLGGHLVQGHVDGVATIASVAEQPQWRITIAPPAHLMPFITPRGSICVAGVSLTIAELSMTDETFEVALIPDTLARTHLGSLKPGDAVNLECDCMVKALIHWQQHYAVGNQAKEPKA